MAAQADNFQYSDYVSDDGVTYAVKSYQFWISDAASGGTNGSTHIPYGRQTRRRAPRKAIFQDQSAFGRRATFPVFTPTAYTALTPGTTTITRYVRGEAAARTYTLVKKVAEKVPSNVIQSSAPQQP